jgi:hypothetical protein
MARQNIGIGTSANDGTGDTLRIAGEKINDNFVELYRKLGGDSNALSTGITLTDDAIVFEGSAVDDFETFLSVVNPTADRNVYLPNASGFILLDSAAQTLTNKNLTSPVLTTPQINDTSADHRYIVAVSELSANRTITLPLLIGNDIFVFAGHVQTLTNKTLTAPTINTPRIGTSIDDTNGAELIRVTATASAVNEITLANAATGGKPTVTASGNDTNITVQINGKGSGSVEINKLAITSSTISVSGAAAAGAGYIICNSGSALAVSLANGTVVGETKIFTNRGAGTATITPANFASGASFAITQNEGAQVIWDGSNWFLIGNQSVTTIA